MLVGVILMDLWYGCNGMNMDLWYVYGMFMDLSIQKKVDLSIKHGGLNRNSWMLMDVNGC